MSSYFSNLESLVLDRHEENGAEELIILSGYIGPLPIQMLANRKIKSKVIWGTLAEDKQTFVKRYHDKYTDITRDPTNNTEVFYKNFYDHSKIYCWLKNDAPIEILAGSANFSNRGLKGANRESLFHVGPEDYALVHNHLKSALLGSVLCSIHPGPILTHSAPTTPKTTTSDLDFVVSTSPPIADIYLGGRGRTIQSSAGLNWGQGTGHNSLDCGELRLRPSLIRSLPKLFPNNGVNSNSGSGQSFRNAEGNAEILFDDGFVMDASFEGLGGEAGNGQRYYKQLTSFPEKKTFGAYFRKRLGLGRFDKVTDQDLENYGRDSIRLELISEGMYFADFSRP